MLLYNNVKKIEGATDKKGDFNGTCEQGFKRCFADFKWPSYGVFTLSNTETDKTDTNTDSQCVLWPFYWYLCILV